jgi:hypothetical protein
LPLKHNETLVGVKTNKKGEIVWGNAPTSKESALIQAKSNFFHPRKLLSMPLLNLKLHTNIIRL